MSNPGCKRHDTFVRQCCGCLAGLSDVQRELEMALHRKRVIAQEIQSLAITFGVNYRKAILALKTLGLDKEWTEALLEVEKEMRL